MENAVFKWYHSGGIASCPAVGDRDRIISDKVGTPEISVTAECQMSKVRHGAKAYFERVDFMAFDVVSLGDRRFDGMIISNNYK